MLPEITQVEFATNDVVEEVEEVQGITFEFDFVTNEFVMVDGKVQEIDEIKSLRMWIETTIRYEKFKFRIYEDIEFGVTVSDLIGSNYQQVFIEAEIQREISEALTKHPLINSVEDWVFEREEEILNVSFTVDTPFSEVEVNYEL